MILISLIVLLTLGFVGPDTSEAGVVNTPASQSIFTEIDPALANELYDCPYLNEVGFFSVLLNLGNKVTSFDPQNMVTYGTEYMCYRCLRTPFPDALARYNIPETDPNFQTCNTRSWTDDEIEEFFDTTTRIAQGPGIGGVVVNAQDTILKQRPASGVVFALDHLDRLVQPEAVYAQAAPYFPGTGFELLSPIQSFWGWAVTISYSFMIIIVIFVALAMVFRQQLGGETVVQIQSAIPSIILAMILIPLSYPITGLFIDGITLGTNIYHDFIFGPAGPGAVVLQEGGGDEPYVEGRQLFADDYRISSLRAFSRIGINDIGNIFQVSCTEDTADGEQFTDDCENNFFPQNTIFSLIDSVLSVFGSSLPQLIGGLINFVFSLVALFVSIRITIRLIKALLVLIVYPIISPFIAATVAFPGVGNKFFVGYLKTLSYAALTFIVTYAMFITAIVFADPVFVSTIPNPSSAAYRPPLLSDIFSGALTAGTSAGVLFDLMAAGLFLAIPTILDSIKNKLAPPNQMFQSVLQDIRKTGVQSLATTGAVGRLGYRAGSAGVSGLRTGVDAGLSSLGMKTHAQRGQEAGARRAAAANQRYEAAKQNYQDNARAGIGSRVRARAGLVRAGAGKMRADATNAAFGTTPTYEEGTSFVNAEFTSLDGTKLTLARLSEDNNAGIPVTLKISAGVGELDASKIEISDGGGSFTELSTTNPVFTYKVGGDEVAQLIVESYKPIAGGAKEHKVSLRIIISQPTNFVRNFSIGDAASSDPESVKLRFPGISNITTGDLKLGLTKVRNN